MTDLFWRCLTCHEHGTTTGTESGADVKHMKATKHATVTSIREPVICGTRETRPDGQYECVRPPQHDDQAHYWVRLSRTPSAPVDENFPSSVVARTIGPKDTINASRPRTNGVRAPVQGLADHKDTTDS